MRGSLDYETVFGLVAEVPVGAGESDTMNCDGKMGEGRGVISEVSRDRNKSSQDDSPATKRDELSLWPVFGVQ